MQIDGFTITKGLADSSTSPDDQGGGMLIVNASPVVIRITFTENAAPVHGGGGMNISGSSNPIVVNTSFINNTGDEGGAMHSEAGTAGGSFVNCLFSGNSSRIEGGAINPGGSGTLTLVNCTFADNFVENIPGGGAIYTENTQGSVVLINCILWGNLTAGNPSQINGTLTALTVSYSDVEGGLPAGINDDGGNINADPLFVDPEDGDYRLMLGSPCFDTGDPDETVIPLDTYDVDQDEITDDPFDPELREPTPDLDLLDRIVNFFVDMGAYEINCPWDLNGDCIVNTSDLLILFSQWGLPPPPNKPADFNNDGIVNTVDLLILFANWGLCDCAPIGSSAQSFEDELADACLTQANWDDYVAVMNDPLSPQSKKDRYQCWMEHYINDCNKCTCLGPVSCPNPDPYN